MSNCPLTPRQLQILSLTADHTNAEIAVALGISLSTVTSHLSIVYVVLLGPTRRKQLPRPRTAAYLKALEEGWIE